MTHARKALRREPIDRRRVRLIQTLLAFPAAGIIGVAGTALARGVLSDHTSVAAPVTPSRVTDEDQARGDRPSDDPSETDADTTQVRAV